MTVITPTSFTSTAAISGQLARIRAASPETSAVSSESPHDPRNEVPVMTVIGSTSFHLQCLPHGFAMAAACARDPDRAIRTDPDRAIRTGVDSRTTVYEEDLRSDVGGRRFSRWRPPPPRRAPVISFGRGLEASPGVFARPPKPTPVRITRIGSCST